MLSEEQHVPFTRGGRKMIEVARRRDADEIEAERQDELLVLLRAASGESAAEFVMSEQARRDKIHLRGLLNLVHAAGWVMGRWRGLPEFGTERSAVLLEGARAMCLSTNWPGWP